MAATAADAQETEAGPEATRPEVPAVRERGGVLTPGGTLVFEPSLEYSHTNVDRFVFQGVEIVDTVLIGVIDASQADRDVVTASLGFRYGISNRLEVELKVPYVYRSDKTVDTLSAGPPTELERSVSSSGLGDVEMAVHAQIGGGGPAFYVANLRVKSNTGDGPFDVRRDPVTGLELDLATGSGFWGIEPSLTVLFPSDPAVFYGNIGYLWNIEENVDTVLRPSGASPGEPPVIIGDVHPGNAVRTSFGMGFAMNEKASFSIGYQHDFLDGTETEVDGVTSEGESLDVGAVVIGANYQATDRTSVNVSVQAGVTDDAPDVRVLLRLPIAFSLF